MSGSTKTIVGIFQVHAKNESDGRLPMNWKDFKVVTEDYGVINLFSLARSEEEREELLCFVGRQVRLKVSMSEDMVIKKSYTREDLEFIA